MTELLVRCGQSNALNDDVTFEIYMDGCRVPSVTHTLEVDSFFKAAIGTSPVVVFVGTCGVVACCGLGMKSTARTENWVWDDFEISWLRALEAAEQVIQQINLGNYRTSSEELKAYANAMEQIRQRCLS